VSGEIDVDRLARALHENEDGPYPAIELLCFHDDTDYEIVDTGPERICHQIAADIIRRYSEERE
jgi:hypothetical protein